MNREDNIYFSRLAEQGERYEDMIKYMKEVCKVHSRLKLKRADKNYPMKSAIFSVWLIRMPLEPGELLGELFQQSKAKKSIKYCSNLISYRDLGSLT